MANVDKSMTIRQVLEVNRGTAQIMMGFGMHCLGCPHASMETLEEAGVTHGIDVEEMVRQINVFLEGKQA
ncbi:MAG: DUF1858 domain-containing protein [Firmicutes bacterium]|nr:DUF1858 domain-containing protein [Bacillota bacterium]